MFRLKKKNLIPYVGIILVLIFLANLIPTLRIPFYQTIKYPLIFFNLLRREISALIFFHRNFILQERLSKENALLKNQLHQADEIYRENARLKKLLSLKQKLGFRVIPAEVIGRSPDNWSAAIIINKGKEQGVRPGMPVAGYFGLLGQVVDSTDSTARIMLLNDLNFAVSAINGRSRQEGLICGTLGSHLVMKYLPKDSDIKPQDPIITSGLTPRYPKGLIIGAVASVAEEFLGLSRYAVIKPAENLSHIEEVLIIVP